MKRTITFLMLLLIVFSSVAQEMMSLGKTKLVKSSPMIAASARTISMRTTVKSAYIFSKVGGIAFIQVAVPNDELIGKDISLVFDEISQKPFINIEQNKYEIPLSNWMLQPIVEFSNDTTNVAVTIYGSGESPILFHPAFVDKLIGLRLLQTDLMLASTYLDSEDRCNLPVNEKKNIIAANSEYVPDDLLERQIYSGLLQAQLGAYELNSNQFFDTYIYTDRDEAIRFGVDDNKFNITGEPYYLFAKRDFLKIDTTEFVRNLNIFLNIQRDYQKCTQNLNKTLISFNKTAIGTLSSGGNIIMKCINNDKYMYDHKNLNQLVSLYYQRDTTVLKKYIKKNIYIDSVLTKEIKTIFSRNNNFNRVNNDISFIMSLVKNLHDSHGIYSLSLIKSYSDALFSLYPESAAAKSLNAVMRDYQVDLLNQYLWFMYRSSVPYAIELHDLTNAVKEMRESIYKLNPTVYDVAVATSKWSAFFRYIKQNNPSNWNYFVNKVRKLKYDAPKVWTPVKLITNNK